MSIRDLLMQDVETVETTTLEVRAEFIERRDIQRFDHLLFEGHIVTVMRWPERTERGYRLVLERAL